MRGLIQQIMHRLAQFPPSRAPKLGLIMAQFHDRENESMVIMVSMNLMQCLEDVTDGNSSYPSTSIQVTQKSSLYQITGAEISLKRSYPSKIKTSKYCLVYSVLFFFKEIRTQRYPLKKKNGHIYPKHLFQILTREFRQSQCHFREPSYHQSNQWYTSEIICLDENLFPGVQTLLNIVILRRVMQTS